MLSLSRIFSTGPLCGERALLASHWVCVPQEHGPLLGSSAYHVDTRLTAPCASAGLGRRWGFVSGQEVHTKQGGPRRGSLCRRGCGQQGSSWRLSTYWAPVNRLSPVGHIAPGTTVVLLRLWPRRG